MCRSRLSVKFNFRPCKGKGKTTFGRQLLFTKESPVKTERLNFNLITFFTRSQIDQQNAHEFLNGKNEKRKILASTYPSENVPFLSKILKAEENKLYIGRFLCFRVKQPLDVIWKMPFVFKQCLFYRPTAPNYINQFIDPTSRHIFIFIQLAESAVTKMRLKSIKQSIFKDNFQT